MTYKDINEIRKKIKEQRPLIHCITNPISINQCANTVLAVGAHPIMAEHPDEVSEITVTAQALMLNLGNITDVRMQSMMVSSEIAAKNKIPIILDLVGIAASSLRRNFAGLLIAKHTPDVIKGNYSEIMALYSADYKSMGVDAELSLDKNNIRKAAVNLALKYGAVILASGKTDIITDGRTEINVNNGTPQMASVTGTGCMLGALASCCLAVGKPVAAISASAVIFGICGELARTDKGNGSFMTGVLDSLTVLSDTDIQKNIKMEVTKLEKI